MLLNIFNKVTHFLSNDPKNVNLVLDYFKIYR
jgi:hypothetical protein